jgi:hypothetical protein
MTTFLYVAIGVLLIALGWLLTILFPFLVMASL